MLSMLIALCSSFITAVTNILVKSATKKIPPILVNFFRVVAAAILLCLLNFHNMGEIIRLVSEVIYLLLYITIAGPILAWYLYTKALREGAVSILHPIANSYPLISIFIGHFILGYKILEKHIIASIMVLVGIFLVTWQGEKVEIRIKPLIFAILATLLWSTNVIAFKMLTYSLSNYQIATLRALMASLLMSPALIKLRKSKISIKSLGIVFLIGAIGDVLGFIVWVTAIAMGPLPVVMPIIALAPVFSAILSKIIFAERVTKVRLTGIIISCLGVGILSL